MLQRNVNTGTMTHEHDAHAEYRLSQFQTCPSPPPSPPSSGIYRAFVIF